MIESLCKVKTGEKIWGKDPRDVRNQRTGSHYDRSFQTQRKMRIGSAVTKRT